MSNRIWPELKLTYKAIPCYVTNCDHGNPVLQNSLMWCSANFKLFWFDASLGLRKTKLRLPGTQDHYLLSVNDVEEIDLTPWNFWEILYMFKEWLTVGEYGRTSLGIISNEALEGTRQQQLYRVGELGMAWILMPFLLQLLSSLLQAELTLHLFLRFLKLLKGLVMFQEWKKKLVRIIDHSQLNVVLLFNSPTKKWCAILPHLRSCWSLSQPTF